MKQLVIGLLGCVVGFNAYAATQNASTVAYKNQRGSVLTLDMPAQKSDTGEITGTFTSAVGVCKHAAGTPVPVQGYYNGNAIAITANYPKCGVVVAMSGHLSKDKNQLQMLWLVTSKAEEPGKKDWNATSTGADHYQRLVSTH